MKKNPFKRGCFRAWFITSVSLVALFTTVTVVCNVALPGVINFAMPTWAPKTIYAEGQEAAYEGSYTTKDQSLAHAREVNQQLCEEGMVLLKNDNNALPIRTPESEVDPAASNPKISIFGKNSVNLALGGSGSSAVSSSGSDDENPASIYTYLEAAGYECNPTLKEFYDDDSKSGSGRSSNPGDLDSGNTVFLETGETPQSSYTEEVKSSYNEYSDAAIVVFTRIGGEGFDLPRTMGTATGARNSDDHFLQLDQNETDLLEAICDANFSHVIVVLNSGSAMELGFLEDPTYYAYQDKIDAAIWMGYPGYNGTTALGEILNGNVNPSGRTVDTFATDFKQDPTWNNFGDNRITGNNGDTSVATLGGDQYYNEDTQEKELYYFVDYEEGVYVGYRYYETRGETDGEDWYNQHVVYPFGYGLSYTTFEWEVQDEDKIPASFTKDDTITVDVKVTNTGDVAGKDVVEMYVAVPYTTGGIEKPSEELISYAKTDLLDPGESQTVTLTFDPYYCASYDYNDKNSNDFKGYELEKGNYDLRISHNAHSVEKTISLDHAEDERYETDPVTGNTVENLYTDQEDSAFNSDTMLSTVLSRADWDGTWPTSPTDDERYVSNDFIEQLKDTSTNNPHNYDEEESYPNTDMDNGLALRDLLSDEDGNFVGSVDYDDSRWDSLLDQMNVSEVRNMYDYASYRINAVDSVQLPNVMAADGPVGWTSFVNKAAFQNCGSYCSGTIVAGTWNKDLAKEYGKSIGEEGYVGNNGTPYTCIYAPGMNIHRSPFGGRCFEYYSEDPYLTGETGAAYVQGCNELGVVPMIKHFALNEQETHRSVTGDCSWVNEQSMREIYLRGFEITVKEGKTRGVMSSFNRIGTRWTGGDYRLLTTILRDEWGFRGAVICDFNTIPDYMDSLQMAYAGGDLNLATQPVDKFDESETGDVVVLRRILHNVAYAIVNSNAIKGDVVGQTMAVWQILLIVIDCVVGAGIIVWGVLVFLHINKLEKAEASSDTKTAN